MAHETNVHEPPQALETPAASPQIPRIDGTKAVGRLFMPVEFKFVSESNPGVFEGYGSVFNQLDWHGDIVVPGAFAANLAQHKAAGTMPALFAEHSFAMFGGDPLPIGVWLDLAEDEKGLRGTGKISALESDHSKRIVGLMRDGALKGLSISYQVPEGGADFGKKPGEPKRWLKNVNLYSVDLVRDPSNPAATVSSMKAVMVQADHATALSSVKNALTLHKQTMQGGDSPTADERAQMLTHLRAAYIALAGDEPKSSPDTIREFEAFLHNPECFSGFSTRRARELAALGWKAAHQPRDEVAAVTEAKTALRASANALRGLTFAS